MKYIITAFLAIFLLINSCLANDEPKKNYTIAIDVGHTPKKHGATSSRGIGEYVYNRKIAIKLYNKLIEKGFFDTFVINIDEKEIKLLERTKVSNKKKANLFISIHHDSVNEKYLKKWKIKDKQHYYSDKSKGYSIFISDNEPENLVFATILGKELLRNNFKPTLHHAEKIKGENRELLDKEKGIYEFGKLVVLRTSKATSLLFECGVILNRKEEQLLSSDEYQDKLSSVIAESIEKYYNSKTR